MGPVRRKLSVVAHWGFAAFALFLSIRALVEGKIHARQLRGGWPDHDILRIDDPGQFWMYVIIFLALGTLLAWKGYCLVTDKNYDPGS